MTELKERVLSKMLKIQSEQCFALENTAINYEMYLSEMKNEIAAQIGIELLENNLIKLNTESSEKRGGTIIKAEFQFIEKDAIIEILNEMNL